MMLASENGTCRSSWPHCTHLARATWKGALISVIFSAFIAILEKFSGNCCLSIAPPPAQTRTPAHAGSLTSYVVCRADCALSTCCSHVPATVAPYSLSPPLAIGPVKYGLQSRGLSI